MSLVVCHPWDHSALWAYERLKQRGHPRLELVAAEALLSAVEWEHRLSPAGAFFTVTLGDGRVFTSESVGAVLNRLASAVPPHFGAASPEDRVYAEQEFAAFCLSWLHCLRGPVLNPTSPQGLGGAYRSEAEWLVLASAAGLSVRPYASRSDDPGWPSVAHPPPGSGVRHVIVVGPEVVGAPEGLTAACLRLSAMSQSPLLGITMIEESGRGPTVSGCNSTPDLTLAGDQVLDALARVLSDQPLPR